MEKHFSFFALRSILKAWYSLPSLCFECEAEAGNLTEVRWLPLAPAHSAHRVDLDRRPLLSGIPGGMGEQPGAACGGTSTWFLLRLLKTPQGLTCSVTLYTSLEPPCWQPGPSQGPSLRPRLRPLVDANQPEIRQETHAPLMPILPKPHVNQPLGSIQWVLSLHETQDPKPSTYLVPKAVPVISLPGVSFVPFLGASVLCCWVTVSALYIILLSSLRLLLL